MQESKTLHYILGISLVMIAAFVVASLAIVNSQADSVATSATVSNTAPTFVGTPVISASAYGGAAYAGGTIDDLVAGGTRTVHLTGVVEDLNGNGDIASVSAAFYRTGVAGGAGCTESSNDCYQVATCDVDTNGQPAERKRFDCVVNLAYYADSTSTGGEFAADTWASRIRVTDVGTLFADNTSITKEMQTLLALNIGASINYGTLGLGASTTSGNNVAHVISQAGNDGADVEVSSSAAATCSSLGSIPVGNQKWSLTDVDYGAGGTVVLTGSPADTNLNIGYRHGANPSANLYWNISIPATGVLGSCTGTTVVSALAS